MKQLLFVVIMLFAFTGTVYAEVNINMATQAELESLQGIGPAKAQAIIAHREKHGAFASKEALEDVDGIGPGTMKQLLGGITVGAKQTMNAVADKK